MKSHVLLGAALLASVLGACAPAVTAPQTGRIVNAVTGEEGTATFTRGTLTPRVGDPFAPDNATIRIGGLTYTGRTYLIGNGALPGGLGFSVAFGASSGTDGSAFTGGGTRVEGGRPVPAYTGNLIARVDGDAPGILTCTLTVDAQERGVGECFDGAGTRYALQF
ncbi:hypothetical protein [Deinococcus xianganensis]|uniref:DUF4402 domain-containing protein n=1 Tax=Deinococcus xianganensis TaxID=1507289 RepID=A0A6I4YGC6_9DEIO|nr:hypothetical protein [Deinococcus xianganensis]MXV18047.1 hypothetical protein [Deinococcus xianganensis]